MLTPGGTSEETLRVTFGGETCDVMTLLNWNNKKLREFVPVLCSFLRIRRIYKCMLVPSVAASTLCVNKWNDVIKTFLTPVALDPCNITVPRNTRTAAPVDVAGTHRNFPPADLFRRLHSVICKFADRQATHHVNNCWKPLQDGDQRAGL